MSRYVPADKVRIIAPIAYGGKKDCTNAMCRRMVTPLEGGGFDLGECLGWHCSYCDEPTSPQGHNCPAADAIIGEARRVAAEQDLLP